MFVRLVATEKIYYSMEIIMAVSNSNLGILQGKKHIHFIGIGGSGMYPIAQILCSKGYELSGSDNNETETLQAVRNMGCKVYMGQRAENIEGAELIVYTAAIMSDNPELVAARESGVPVIERSEILGLISSWYENAICVSGTHGKTTATSMLTQIFVEAGEDISCVIGGKLKAIGGGSGKAGESDTFLCESCEFEDHYLKLHPDVAVILNVDADHLDYFKNLDNIKKSFRNFASLASKCLIINGDDKNTVEAVAGLDKEIITFGFDEKNDYYAKILGSKGLRTDFEIFSKGRSLGQMSLYVPGKHNVLNATAAAAAAMLSGVTAETIKTALEKFPGAGRRFEKMAYADGVTVVDDYAHHPTELEAVLTAAKSLDFNKVWAVFQPFTYSRTEILMDDFARVLKLADRVVLTDIMGSREKNTNRIYTRQLAEKIDGCIFFDAPDGIVDAQTAQRKEANFDEIINYLLGNLEEGDLVITLGCGDAYKLAKKLGRKLTEREKER